MSLYEQNLHSSFLQAWNIQLFSRIDHNHGNISIIWIDSNFIWFRNLPLKDKCFFTFLSWLITVTQFLDIYLTKTPSFDNLQTFLSVNLSHVWSQMFTIAIISNICLSRIVKYNDLLFSAFLNSKSQIRFATGKVWFGSGSS